MDSAIILTVLIIICLLVYKPVGRFIDYVWELFFPYKKNKNTIEAMHKQRQEIMHKYEEHQMGDKELTSYQKELINNNRNLLLSNGVPIAKVRFVFHPTFTYDVDADTVNPKYSIMLPVNSATNLFMNDLPVLEIGKPKNIITASMKSYSFDDNYSFIKDILKMNKRGVVIMIGNQEFVSSNINQDYFFSVDGNKLRMVILDDEVNRYNKLKQ